MVGSPILAQLRRRRRSAFNSAATFISLRQGSAPLGVLLEEVRPREQLDLSDAVASPTGASRTLSGCFPITSRVLVIREEAVQ